MSAGNTAQVAQRGRGVELAGIRKDTCAPPSAAQTFNGDGDDVVDGAQRVLGGAAVLAGVRFRHAGDAQILAEVVIGEPFGGQLPAHLGPGDVRSGPVQGERET